MNRTQKVTFFSNDANEAAAALLIINGEEHLTSDLRRHRPWPDTVTLVTSKSTKLGGTSFNEGWLKTMREDVAEDYMGMIELECDVTNEEHNPGLLSYCTVRHIDIDYKLTFS